MGRIGQALLAAGGCCIAAQLGCVSLSRGAKIAVIFFPCVCHHGSVSLGEDIRTVTKIQSETTSKLCLFLTEQLLMNAFIYPPVKSVVFLGTL